MALDIGLKAFRREVRRARVEGRPPPTVAMEWAVRRLAVFVVTSLTVKMPP